MLILQGHPKLDLCWKRVEVQPGEGLQPAASDLFEDSVDQRARYGGGVKLVAWLNYWENWPRYSSNECSFEKRPWYGTGLRNPSDSHHHVPTPWVHSDQIPPEKCARLGRRFPTPNFHATSANSRPGLRLPDVQHRKPGDSATAAVSTKNCQSFEVFFSFKHLLIWFLRFSSFSHLSSFDFWDCVSHFSWSCPGSPWTLPSQRRSWPTLELKKNSPWSWGKYGWHFLFLKSY